VWCTRPFGAAPTLIPLQVKKKTLFDSGVEGNLATECIHVSPCTHSAEAGVLYGEARSPACIAVANSQRWRSYSACDSRRVRKGGAVAHRGIQSVRKYSWSGIAKTRLQSTSSHDSGVPCAPRGGDGTPAICLPPPQKNPPSRKSLPGLRSPLTAEVGLEATDEDVAAKVSLEATGAEAVNKELARQVPYILNAIGSRLADLRYNHDVTKTEVDALKSEVQTIKDTLEDLQGAQPNKKARP